MRRSTRASLQRRARETDGRAFDANTRRVEVALEHHTAGRLAVADDLYRRILARDPRHPGALHLSGLVAFQRGDLETAIELIGRAIAARPSEAIFRCNLGVVLRRLDRLEEALEAVEMAAALDPLESRAVVERGQVLFALRRPSEALSAFESVVEREPDNALAHLGVALAALTLGNFQRGWPEYEWRWRHVEYAGQLRGFSQPAWDGQSFAHKTVLLHAEQGLGDTLQFVRFAPLVKARGGRVLLECQPELADLLAGVAGVDQLIARGDALPAFDIHAALMSLPALLGTRLDTIPATVPYLPEARERRPLLAAADRRLKVGIVWAGSAANQNDHQRSMPLCAFEPLAALPDVALFALQTGSPGEQLSAWPPALGLTDLSAELGTFADTASMLGQLDLVITVDTAMAHLAGALGRPVWLLLPFAPDFRWMLDRQDSPWYPTLRIFRQQRRRDWSPVMREVREALADAAASHQPRAASRAISTAGAARSPGSPAVGAGGLVAALPVNGSIGWAVCGRHLANELARLRPLRLVSDPFDAEGVGGQDAYRSLRALVPSESEPPRDRPFAEPVLQAITSSRDFAPFRPDVRSSASTVGYTFFEENILSPEAVEHASRAYDRVVAGSTWCAEVLRGYKLEAVSTIIQGIDPLVFHPSPSARRTSGDRFVVFSGGKLEFRKGQDLVMRAFKVLQDRHADVLLVNAWFNPWAFSLDTMAASPYIEFKRTTSQHLDFVGQLLAANGIDLRRVVTLPSTPNASMPGVYWDSDVGLFPNRCEGGTNLVLMEYMASGKPAIASCNSGHRDIVNHRNALLIEQMTPLLMNDDDRPIAIWDDPSLDETIERLEWAYQHASDLEPIGKQAALDLAALTWARTAEAFDRLLPSPDRLATVEPESATTRIDTPGVIGATSDEGPGRDRGRDRGDRRLAADDVRKLEGFLNRLAGDVYPEPVSEPHQSITRAMVERLLAAFPQPADACILDVGCGQGLALVEFAARGLRPRGIALGHEDVAACRQAGFDVRNMDQSFLEFGDAEFDVIWCRHCLEHSVFPYFTLSEFQRVLKPAGVLYVEVPAPDTSCAHQANPNHYSVLGKSMWLQLMARSGFVLVEQIDLNFSVPAGPDTYWAFFLRKPAGS